jgi:serine/threonine protein kinase/Tol biopolymer transport system component
VRLNPGARIGNFEVIALLGTGGMSDVYRARDTRLGREVAIKVISESLGTDPTALERFQREARAAGSLNHPNVVALYDLGLEDGQPYLVTELLQGETLRQKLADGPVPLGTALDWASQIARGLAAAHARGIVHRDLKPENLFATRDGQLKLLDFGIAKLTEAVRNQGGRDLMSDTASSSGGQTGTGVTIGSPSYMSPEQVRGGPVDARTDSFALGAVLYEMLSGRRAFPGATFLERNYATLHHDPQALPDTVPPNVAQIVRRCLEKDPDRRFQSASDLAFALEVLRTPTGAGGPSPVPSPRSTHRTRWLVGGTLAALALAFALAVEARFHRDPRAHIPSDVEPVTFRWGTTTAARFLPDGRIAFSAAFEDRPEELFVRPSGSPSAQELGVQDARLLAASRTGQLAIKLHPGARKGDWSTPGTLAEVPSIGGRPRELEEAIESADWSPAGELAMVHKSSGSWVLEFPRGTILFRTKGWLSDPRFSPKGDRIAFLHHPEVTDDMGEVVVTDLEGRNVTLSERWPTTAGLAWSPDGRQVWIACGLARHNLLVSVSLEKEEREIYRGLVDLRLEDVNQGGEALISSGVDRVELVYAGERGDRQRLLSWTAINDVVASLSSDGKVLFSAFRPGPTPRGELQPFWVVLRSVDGSPAQVLGTGNALDLSSDGRWALVSSADNATLTALPTGVGQPRAIATHGLEVFWARWIPGKPNQVLAIGRTPGVDAFRLYRLPGDGSKPVLVSETPVTRSYFQVSADGLWAAASTEDLRLVIISLRDGAAFPVPRTPQRTTPQRWSPEGQLWVTEEDRRGATRLLRLEPHTGDVLEERTVGPAEREGATTIRMLAMTPDGKKLAFTYDRSLSSLFIVRGLEQR